MSDEINKNFSNIEVEILEGGRGEFRVIAGDDPAHMIYDMSQIDGFPSPGEITKLLRGNKK